MPAINTYFPTDDAVNGFEPNAAAGDHCQGSEKRRGRSRHEFERHRHNHDNENPNGDGCKFASRQSF
jgi:hypothetical protein